MKRLSPKIHLKFNFQQFETVLFFVLLFVFILPIWWNKYFLTGDGPCHLYNSKVLLDFVTSHNLDFYKQYYQLNENPEPNWFSHVSLAFLLYLFPGFLAEKIFLTIYVILFAIGLRLLLKAINSKNTYITIMGLLFVFHHPLQMGFYNYSFSFVFFFFSVWYWLKNYPVFKFHQVLLFMGLNLLSYFTHPVGFLLSGLTIGLIVIIEFSILFFKKNERRKALFKKLFKAFLIPFIAFFPAILLMLNYIFRKGLNSFPNPDSFERMYQTFLELTSLVTLTSEEKSLSILVAILFGTTLLYAIGIKIRDRKFNNRDAFFLLFGIILLIYFNQPGGLAGAGILSIRLQFIPYLMILLWFGNIEFNINYKKFLTLSFFLIGITFSVIRFPHLAKASEAVEEYVSVDKYIDDCSTVLPLSFAHNGKTPEGELIANKIWLFKHASDYLGTGKSLVLFGNYEGVTGYFPILWRPEKNPFVYISTNEGIEFQPPSVDILSYPEKTGGTIDYVITWCLDGEHMEHEYTKKLLVQLAEGYELVFISEHKRTRLYRRLNR